MQKNEFVEHVLDQIQGTCLCCWHCSKYIWQTHDAYLQFEVDAIHLACWRALFSGPFKASQGFQEMIVRTIRVYGNDVAKRGIWQ
jgi:hypothetical protein